MRILDEPPYDWDEHDKKQHESERLHMCRDCGDHWHREHLDMYAGRCRFCHKVMISELETVKEGELKDESKDVQS